MSYFEVIMHQIRFRLGYCPVQTPLANSSSTPKTILGVTLLREGKREGGREETGKKGKEEGVEKIKGKGRGINESESPPIHICGFATGRSSWSCVSTSAWMRPKPS